jgi:hypothetical protein
MRSVPPARGLAAGAAAASRPTVASSRHTKPLRTDASMGRDQRNLDRAGVDGRYHPEAVSPSVLGGSF